MRILLATSASYIPTRGGATRANRVWLERLSLHGHEACVITPSFKHVVDDEPITESRADVTSHPQTNNIVCNGVRICLASRNLGIVAQMERAIKDFSPDWVLVSSEDFGQARLRAALRVSPEKTIYLAHTPQFFPFGPDSINPSIAGTKAISTAAAVVVIGEYTRRHCETYLGRPVVVAHPPIYGSGTFPNHGARNEGYITMINPSSVKGISIFVSMAAHFTNLRFAALPGWATTQQDIASLASIGVQILSPCHNIDEVFAKTRILVVPSLWAEGFGLVVVEAMLRGIPVLASNLGGLTEAKLNTKYLFAVNAIRRYLPARDEVFMPIPDIPEQNSREWIRAVRDLSEDSLAYMSASRESRRAAETFVKNIDPDKLEHTLAGMLRQANATLT